MPIHKKVNKDFFKKWSSEMVYILGFFAADGYMTINKRGGQFWCIDIKDKKHLENIRITIGSNHKISLRKRKIYKHTTFRLQIGSIEMCEDLRKIGFEERKTKRLIFPSIPNKYLHHFVRGYFDGDGNVWVGLAHKRRKTSSTVIQTVFTSCSKNFLSALSKNLELNNVKKGRIRKGKGNYYRLVYSVNNSLKLYNFMYNDLGTSNLFLKRKKDVFEKYIKMRE